MPIITAIGFDADDTLWESEIHYVSAKDEFARLLSAYAPFDQVKADLDVIETHNVQLYGYGFKSFTLSMIETALQVSGGSVPAGLIEKVLAMAKRALQSEIRLREGAEKVLQELREQSPQYSLFMITKGELFEQQQKIQKSGLKRYFHYLEVVSDKTPEAYLKPVVSIQGWAVLVPHPLTWSHETNPGKDVPDGRWFELPRLSDLPDFLKRFNAL